jgi:RNA polymerase sigma-70 factor (ECF subfamily)
LSADDIVQDVFENLFRCSSRFDARRGGLGPYLAMQARSRCVDLIRSQSNRRSRERRHDRFGHAPPAEEEALRLAQRAAVRRALSDLSLDERRPIELAFFDGLTYRAVAEYLAIPEGTVKSRIRNGLLRLRVSPGLLVASAEE